MASAESAIQRSPSRSRLPAILEPTDDTGVGPAPAETVALWVELIASMGPDELSDFEAVRSASGTAHR
jgi:hypothetical protein